MDTAQIGSRVSYNGYICTIRFIGQLPAWPEITAYGVEWDDPTRGKHSGELNGTQYFKTHVPGAGSFIKSSRKQDETKDFRQALYEKYAPDTPFVDQEIHISRSKTIQNVGFDKFQRRQSRFDQLPIVSLSNSCLLKPATGVQLPSLKSLDLSNNLFTSLETVYEICKELLSLESLSLNGNRLTQWRIRDGSAELPAVRSLSLSATLITTEEIYGLSSVFPNVSTITLANNELDNGFEGPLAFSSLSLLDLSYNNFTDIPKNLTVDELNMSHNKIARVSTRTTAKSLNLSYNEVHEWSVVDSIPSLANELTALRINNNPLQLHQLVIENESAAQTHNSGNTATSSSSYPGAYSASTTSADDSFIIGRVGSITKLNGMEISSRQRTDAELFFMGKVAQKLVPKCSTERWKELCEMHGEPSVAEPIKNTINSRLLEIKVVYGSESKKLKLLRNLTVQKLKATLAKQFNLDAFCMRLKTSSLDIDEPLRHVDYYVQSGDEIIIEMQ